MESVCICGAGTMGRGITLAIAMQGIPVMVYDLNRERLTAASSAIEKELGKSVAKNSMTAIEKENTLRRITFTHSPDDCRAPLVIEAILEKTEIKTALFLELARVNPPETIFATNTSSLSVTAIAEGTVFPERIVGLHFFNPANRMKLVEIIRTKYNSAATLSRMRSFIAQIGKTAVLCADAPGFIVNRVARPYYLEAFRLAEKGIADMEVIDRLMESAGFKMGPFHLMDLIGNDINYAVSSALYQAYGKPERLKPSVLQENMVKKGELGIKTGSGFFQYAKPAQE